MPALLHIPKRLTWLVNHLISSCCFKANSNRFCFLVEGGKKKKSNRCYNFVNNVSEYSMKSLMTFCRDNLVAINLQISIQITYFDIYLNTEKSRLLVLLTVFIFVLIVKYYYLFTLNEVSTFPFFFLFFPLISGSFSTLR